MLGYLLAIANINAKYNLTTIQFKLGIYLQDRYQVLNFFTINKHVATNHFPKLHGAFFGTGLNCVCNISAEHKNMSGGEDINPMLAG